LYVASNLLAMASAAFLAAKDAAISSASSLPHQRKSYS
jgi:hypothetical protein